MPRVQIWLNSSFQRSIGTAPFRLLIGTHMKLATDVDLKKELDQELVTLFMEEREELRRSASQNISQVQQENSKILIRNELKQPTIR